VDYGFHLAPMDASHIDEIPELIVDARRGQLQDLHVLRLATGCTALRGPQREFLMIGKGRALRLRALRVRHARPCRRRASHAGQAAQISLSLHCETAEIMTAYTKRVEKDKSLSGLAAYSARGRSTPKGWRCSSPPTWPTRPRCPTSTCCT
jgi:allantoinase